MPCRCLSLSWFLTLSHMGDEDSWLLRARIPVRGDARAGEIWEEGLLACDASMEGMQSEK
jgi:hypothetical protein